MKSKVNYIIRNRMIQKNKNKNKLLNGGDGNDGTSINFNMHKLSIYYATIIIGYFGSKIFMGFYKVYSKKTPDKEVNDFITLSVLSFLTYIFTGMNSRDVLGSGMKANIAFFIGYLIGLNYPAIRYSIDGIKEDQDSKTFKGLSVFFYSVVVIMVITMLFFGARSARDAQDYSSAGSVSFGGYVLFIIIIVLLVCGIIYTRKKARIYTKLNKEKGQTKYVTVQTKSDSPHLDPVAFSWLLTLIFMYDAQEHMINMFISLINGVVLGIFVSGLSMYGINYILVENSSVECNPEDKDDCINKGLKIDNQSKSDKIATYQKAMKSNITTLRWLSGIIITVLILVIIMFFYSRGVQLS